MRKTLSKVALAAAALVGASTSANAYVVLQLADLGPGNVIQTMVQCNTSVAQGAGNCDTVDGFSGYVLNGNGITFQGTVGSFSVFTTSGVGNQPGDPDFANLDTSSTRVKNNNISGSGLDSLYILFQGYDFMFPDGAQKNLFGTASYSGTVSGGAGASIVTNFYADGTNAGLASNGLTCSMTVVTNGSCDTGAPTLWTDPAVPAGFSLSTQQTFTINAQSQVNATTSVIATRIPEPISTSLVGLGLLGLALTSRRRTKKV